MCASRHGYALDTLCLSIIAVECMQCVIIV